jgi:hypothetical protein
MELSIGQAWDEARRALSAQRRLIVPVVLGLILLPAVIATMVQPRVPPGTTPEPGGWMVVALAMVVVMLLGQIAVVLLVNGWRGSVGEAIGQAARRLPVLVAAGLIVGLPMFILLSLALGIVALASGGSGQFVAGALSAKGALVLVLTFAALLFVAVRLLPMPAVVAPPGMGPIATLRQTFRLTRGHFWRLLGFLLVIFVPFLVLAMAVGTVIGAVVTVALGAAEPWTVALLLLALAGGLVQTAFVTVFTAMIARITAQLETARK